MIFATESTTYLSPNQGLLSQLSNNTVRDPAPKNILLQKLRDSVARKTSTRMENLSESSVRRFNQNEEYFCNLMDFPVIFLKKIHILDTLQFAYANSSMEVPPTTSKFLNVLLFFLSFI